jgi:acyl dehydratase
MFRKIILAEQNHLTILKRHLSGQKTYDFVRVISKDDVSKFSIMTGDTNPVHFEGDSPIVHGALLVGIVSAIIGTK